MPYLERHQIRWYYETQGEGTPLLFIHGWAVNHKVFSQQAEYFSKDYKVVLVDLPGHGKTSWYPVLLEEIAEALADIVMKVDSRPFDIVGSSLGGFVGLRMAEFLGSRVKKLVMVGALPRFVRSPEKPLGLSEAEMQKLESQIEARYPSILDIFFRSLFTHEERESPKFKWIHQFRKDDDLPQKDALLYFLRLLEKQDLTELLCRILADVLVLSGRQDYICSAASVKYLSQIMPQATYDVIEGSGHFPFLVKTQEFNQKVETFLRKQ